MDNLLHNIARIIQQDGLNESGQSLFHGKTGLSVFFYQLAQKTGDPGYIKIADDLLDSVFTNMTSLSPADFENGFAGIGFGIEYLVQNNFVEGDTDVILEEIDNKVFRVLNEESINSFELTNGLTGYLFYLISRLKNKTEPLSMAQQINRELLILSINKIYDLVTVQFPLIVKDICFDLAWKFPVMLIGLNEAYSLNVYNQKINCIIRQWLPNLEAYIPSMHINRLYLSVVLRQLFTRIPDPRLEKQIKILLYGIELDTLLSEVDSNQNNLRFGWPGSLLILDQAIKIVPSGYPNYKYLHEAYEKIINGNITSLKNPDLADYKTSHTKFGISEGLAGIGLLSLLVPELLPVESQKI
jgi:hypothetical protein